ncbi:ABC transporter permease [Nocardioides bruguierae]|uniref:ABC transporter permease n=1 Tax=Nocardioides bruguierae TaxID=2945102 RepID=UPI0020205EA5|nr:ABC transporter permease [Nocardioides bruguierae]MCL8026825.1 ABC transporter permease [Nocardioides bruguierae]
MAEKDAAPAAVVEQAPTKGRPGPRRLVVAVVGLTLALVVLLLCFALPASNTGAHGIPVGVVGPEPVATAIEAQLDGVEADGFEVTRFDDEDAARDAILDREVYGALEPGADGSVTVLVASAASTQVSALLQQVGTSMAVAQGGVADVVELRAFPEDDPRGAGLAAGALPLALGGWIAAVVIMALTHSHRSRMLTAAGFSVVGAFGLTAALEYVVGTLDGDYLLTSLAVMLGLAATAFAVIGLRSAFGGAGLGVAAVALVLLGNPLSGLTSAPEMLPSPWGALGQLLPPGATGTLLRDVAFFDGAGATHSVVVLLCWLVGGLALALLAWARDARRAGGSAHDADPDHGVERRLEAAVEGHGA